MSDLGETMTDSEFAHDNGGETGGHGGGRGGAQVEYAGFWIRVGATLIDMLLIAVVSLLAAMPVLFFINNFTYLEAEESARRLSILLDWALPAVLIILFWIYRQATPGKMAVRVKIVDARSGGKPSVGQCIGRYFAYFPSFMFFGIGILWVAFDERKQGWHDKLAGTLVIKEAKKPMRPE